MTSTLLIFFPHHPISTILFILSIYVLSTPFPFINVQD
ncbi:MAG: hypothetical protein RL076_2765 [Chloroflexota bacterium]